MSIHENVQFFHPLNLVEYIEILKNEYGAKEYPSQKGAFLLPIGEISLPFYSPRTVEDHISILGFNYVPLPDQLIKVLIDHPDLAPDSTIVRWTQEQELFLESTLGELRKQLSKHDS